MLLRIGVDQSIETGNPGSGETQQPSHLNWNGRWVCCCSILASVVRGHEKVPAGGHLRSPLVATKVPTCGHEKSPPLTEPST